MPRSLLNGNYHLLGVVRSGSDPNAWYRVMRDTDTPRYPSGNPKLSCDCPAWTRNQRNQEERSCKHTDPFHHLLTTQTLPEVVAPPTRRLDVVNVIGRNPLLHHITGSWKLQERIAPIISTRGGVTERDLYYWIMLSVQTTDQVAAAGMIAVPLHGGETVEQLAEETAAWAGWMIAQTFARRGRMQIGMPPAHFRATQPRRATRREQGTHTRPPVYGIGDLIRAADQTDLGDGLRPQQRAEALLQLFLGSQYELLCQQGYLDVPSARPQDVLAKLRAYDYSVPITGEVVYRVRLDPQREYDRRVRLFINGDYKHDLCIVREGNRVDVPVQDAFLSIFMGLMASELYILQVVGSGNVFSTFSDGDDRPGPRPVWLPRLAA